MTMVFGNMGDDSATGVAMTRNSSTGENCIEGDYLTNAQGEDVVAGIRDMYRTIAGIHVFWLMIFYKTNQEEPLL